MGISDLFAEGKKPNLLLIITDQERSIQHWPDDFIEKHLPAMSRLMANGLTFSKAFTGACMCSPSRATFLTSQYPAQTGVTTTGSPEPRYPLPRDIINLATMLRKAGYATCAWRGKWHLGGVPEDYGFEGWVPPDAGNYLSLNDTLGGGTPNNDNRFLNEIIDFLDRTDHTKPFCLVASFVNPHDVYVAQYEPALGYTKEDFHRIYVPLPNNAKENLEDKPRAQIQFSWPYVHHSNSMQEYVNFYAYLHTVVDAQISQVLAHFDKLNLTDDTLVIRFADHGEQALNHGLVEKFFNAYEESIRIPMVFSNPIAYPIPSTTESLASSLDLVPTLAHLLGVQNEFKGCFVGENLSPVLEDPLVSVRTAVHFTYDDITSIDGPSVIRCIRTSDMKYSVYYTKDGKDADWELYNLVNDPEENNNIAGDPNHQQLQQELDNQLLLTMKEMKTMSEFTWPPKATLDSRGIR